MLTLPEARSILAKHRVRGLLADPTDNPKLAKSLGLKVLSAPLHLAPADLSGYQVCPMATAGCKKACLHTAGNPAFMAQKHKSRIARTRAFFRDRAAFMTLLVAEVEAHERRAKKRRMACAVRLNATSDVRWETVPCVRNGQTFPNIMTAFPAISWYDYTKLHNRKGIPSNYHLTFSAAENNEHRAIDALQAGMNVAMVFAVTPHKPLPATYNLDGVPVKVIDGDTHDYRPADPRGVIVGLRAKGKARKDKSGFVRHVTQS